MSVDIESIRRWNNCSSVRYHNHNSSCWKLSTGRRYLGKITSFHYQYDWERIVRIVCGLGNQDDVILEVKYWVQFLYKSKHCLIKRISFMSIKKNWLGRSHTFQTTFVDKIVSRSQILDHEMATIIGWHWHSP